MKSVQNLAYFLLVLVLGVLVAKEGAFIFVPLLWAVFFCLCLISHFFLVGAEAVSKGICCRAQYLVGIDSRIWRFLPAFEPNIWLDSRDSRDWRKHQGEVGPLHRSGKFADGGRVDGVPFTYRCGLYFSAFRCE